MRRGPLKTCTRCCNGHDKNQNGDNRKSPTKDLIRNKKGRGRFLSRKESDNRQNDGSEAADGDHKTRKVFQALGIEPIGGRQSGINRDRPEYQYDRERDRADSIHFVQSLPGVVLKR